MSTNVNVKTNAMYLVYADSNGEHYYQYWTDVAIIGGLIDPETGEDMKLIGWLPDNPNY